MPNRPSSTFASERRPRLVPTRRMQTSSGVPDVVERLDARVLGWVDAADHGPLRGPLRGAARAGDVLAPLLAASAWLVVRARPGDREVVLRSWSATGASALVLGALVKPAFSRERPETSHVSPGQRPRTSTSSSAFPSGHLGATAAFTVVASRARPRLAPWLVANAVVTAYSRLYTARHFLSDLVVGAAIGTAVGIGADRLVTRVLDGGANDVRPAPLRRRWTVVGDRVLHSRETADASVPGARPVLLLHGVGTTTRYHRPVLHALRGRLPAVAVELPGIGSSSSDDIPNSVAGQADVVAEWLRTTGRRPLVVAGNSMGAQTAVELAVRHPDLAERVVLLGPTVDRRSRNLPQQIVKLAVDATRERPILLAITVTDTFLTRRRAVNRYLRAALDHRVEERIAQVRAPVLVVRGERDPLVPRRWAQHLADAAPRGRFHEVPGAAHAVHHGRPEAVADLLVEVATTPS